MHAGTGAGFGRGGGGGVMFAALFLGGAVRGPGVQSSTWFSLSGVYVFPQKLKALG